jgi:hypothetical protein
VPMNPQPNSVSSAVENKSQARFVELTRQVVEASSGSLI